MNRPAWRDVFDFLFRHEHYKRRQEAEWFRWTVTSLALHYGVNHIPAVTELANNAEVIVRKKPREVLWKLDDLNPRTYFEVDETHMVVRVTDPAMKGNRVIPPTDVFDLIMKDRGQITEIELSPEGMSVDTTSGYIIQAPTLALVFAGAVVPDAGRQHFYTGRLRIMRDVLRHLTQGAINVSEDDLYHTKHLVIRYTDGRWAITERVNVATISPQ